MPIKSVNPTKGLTCPECGGVKNRCLTTVQAKNSIYRFRYCTVCGERFSTREIRVREYKKLLGVEHV